MARKEEIMQLFPRHIRDTLSQMPFAAENVQEIRLRADRPLILIAGGNEYLLKSCTVTPQDLKEAVEYISSYSLYAFEEDIKRGFLTIQGGHRVGIAGKVVVEQGEVKCIRNISFLNIRFAHEIKGCGRKYFSALYDGNEVFHTLIVSPPMGGKTTLLRDLIRIFSNAGHTVSVIDERSEIAGCYMGIPCNDVGIRTDVLDRCPKALGMEMVIRSMAPEIVAVDEIGGKKDFDALRDVLNCGCKILATMHGRSIEDLLRKPFFAPVFAEGIFQRFLIKEDGRKGEKGKWKVYDENGQVLAIPRSA